MNVYKFYNAYLKLVLGVVFDKIWGVLYNKKISYPEMKTYYFTECKTFQKLCEKLLDKNNFYQHLSVLLAETRKLSDLMFNIYSKEKNIFVDYSDIKKKNK